MLARVLSLIWFLSWAPLSRGLDSTRPDQLAFSPKWLRLGHYEKNFFGYSSPFRGPLFLHPKGFNDPLAELQATVDAFRAPTPEQLARLKMHPQCFFAARFRWLKQYVTFDKIEACEERREWKRKLNAREASLIFASADMNNAPSTFGHTFLKLINPDNKKSKELVDYGINYAADGNPGEAVFYAIKGLIGLYGGYFSMMPYHQKIRQYTNMEGRDIWEYRLNLTAEQTDELLDHLLEMEGSRAPYYFLSDNCSYQIIKALEVVAPELDISENLPVYVIPLDIIKLAARAPGFMAPPVFQRSLKSEYLQDFARLNGRQRRALDEAVETLAVTDTALDTASTARVYEAAMKYYALKSYDAGQDLASQKHTLAVQRAKLGPVTDSVPAERPRPPHLSHDSSALYLGGGETRGLGHFASLKLRTAFHDLEQEDSGLARFSKIEILGIEARRYRGDGTGADEGSGAQAAGNRGGRWSLHKVTPVDLLSTTPLTSLDKHLSWRASAEILDPWILNLSGGAGASYDLAPWLRVTQLLNGRYLGGGTRRARTGGSTSGNSNSYSVSNFLGAGPNLIAIARSGPFGLSLDGGYYFSEGSRRLWDFRARANVAFTRSWDLQAEWLNRGPDFARLEREWHARVLYNFLF